MWETAEIVGHPEDRLFFSLTITGASLHLQIHLVNHPKAGGANWMAETFKTAVNLAGDLAIRVIEPVHHVIDRSPLVGDIEILHRHQLGDGKAVMNFKHADLFAWLGDASFLIGTVRRRPGSDKVAAVPGVMLCFPTVGRRQLQCFHRDQVSLAERFRNLRRCDNRTG